MSKTITSGAITFMDTTDNRRLDVYITSNLPTIQIKNTNTNTYTPDWTSTPLVLDAEAYLDSQDVTSKATFSWYKKTAIGTETPIASNTTTITIDTNNLDADQLITYVCKAIYRASDADNGVEDIEQITFTQVATGQNGSDGTSVNIKGTATSVTQVTDTDYYTIAYRDANITTAEEGDAYLYNGNLYVCVVKQDGVDYFINVGNIQGAPGKDGQDAKAIFLNANTQIFKVSKTGTVLPTTIKVTAQPVNTNITSYTYSIDGGQTFSSNAPTGVSRNGNQITMTGASMTASSVTIMVTDGQYQDTFTVYKVSDGSDGTPGADGKPAPIAFLTNESIGFAANSKGQVSATSAVTNVVAFVGTSSVKPTIGTLSGVPEGMSITQEEVGNEILLTLNITNNSTLGSSTSNGGRITIPVTIPTTPAITTNLQLGWNKVNAGRSVSSIAARYAVSNSNTTAPTSWNITIPIRGAGQYLWMADYITYDDGANATVGPRVVTGDSGTPGVSITSVKSYFSNNQSNTSAPDTTATWTTSPTRQTGYYTWRKDLITYSSGSTEYTTPVCITGDKGDQGVQGVPGPQGVNGKTSYFHIKYSVNANGNPMTETPSTYIGTYVDYTEDDSSDYTKYKWSRFVGSQGAKGDQGIAGTNGEDGKTSYLHIAYATSADGKTGFSVSDSVSKTYIGQYTDYTEADSTDPTKYKWTLIKGDKGDQGVQGPKGNDGQQLYTWIKYADTPTSGMSNSPDGKTYIGLAYNKTTATESSTYSDYAWSLIKGSSGTPGKDGQTYYTWVKYADDASGSNMSDDPFNKSYIGLAYNKTSATESTVASDYQWSLFRGADGVSGEDAVTFQVYSTDGYILSTNTPKVTLQTFAYAGDTPITGDVAYQWYQVKDGVTTAISGANGSSYDVYHSDVSFTNTYMCTMTFKGVDYSGVVTIDDKNDTNTIFSSKPTSYSAGDIWVVGSDYAPTGYEIGTVLKAEHTNNVYNESDWVTATRYDDVIKDLSDNVTKYDQFFDLNQDYGLRITARDSAGNESEFSTVLSSDRLSFNQGDEAIAYVSGNKLHIKEAEIISPLTVTGKYSGSTMQQAPVINLGGFSLVIESNGSLSIISNN